MPEEIIDVIRAYSANKDGSVALIIPKNAREQLQTLGKLEGTKFLVKLDLKNRKLVYEMVEKEAPKISC